MSDYKFKVGDTVETLDGKNIEGYTCGWIPFMETLIGKKAKVTERRISSVYDKPCYKLDIPGARNISWDERGLRLAKPEKETIVIYRKDNKVVALKKNTGETATARCNPTDTFDFNIGARLAFNRLMGVEDPLETKYYNGKVVCVDNHGTFHTVGKIREFKNGQFIDDYGRFFPEVPITSLDDLKRFSIAEWIEIVE